MPVKTAAVKKIGIFGLAAIIFFTISGGPYGLEPLLSYCGGKAAFIMLVTIPLLWDIPIICTVLELNSMMPVTGGYYEWVKRALGLRWAFYEGWWSWLYTFIDLAIYPQLIIMYASLFFPQIAAHKLAVYLCFIWACAILNILGIRPVGKTSIVMSILVIVPFFLLFIFGIHYAAAHPAISIHYDQAPKFLGLAIFTVIWNLIGWDNITTYAGEVENPVTSYLRAISVTFVFIFLLYFGITYIAHSSGISPAQLRDSGYPALGLLVGGKWLSIVIAAGGMVSSMGLFLAILLSVSRIPEVMANDKLLPSVLHHLHPRYGTPYISIIICATIVSFMVMLSFGELLIIDITVYFVGIMLEFISLITLRIKEPQAHRPFRIPLGVGGLSVLYLLPLSIYSFAFYNVVLTVPGVYKSLIIIAVMLLSGVLMWWLVAARRAKIVEIKAN
ncbi:MAG: APC family permease [Flavipsychrobacter sp.]